MLLIASFPSTYDRSAEVYASCRSAYSVLVSPRTYARTQSDTKAPDTTSQRIKFRVIMSAAYADAAVHAGGSRLSTSAISR